MPDKQQEAVQAEEAATHPEAGSGLKPEGKSFDLERTGKDRDKALEGAKGGAGEGSDPASAAHLDRGQGAFVADAAEEAEIAADDAGASAMAERAQKRIESGEVDG